VVVVVEGVLSAGTGADLGEITGAGASPLLTAFVSFLVGEICAVVFSTGVVTGSTTFSFSFSVGFLASKSFESTSAVTRSGDFLSFVSAVGVVLTGS